MPAFAYVALDTQGKESRGLLEGDSARQIRQQLREKSLVPLDVAEAHGGRKSKEKTGRKPLFARGISARELALLTRQMATLEQAGMPIEETLRAVSQQSEKPRIKSMMLSVRSRVMEGYTLDQGLGDFPHAFPDMYRATVAAGEHAGHLGPILERLADYTETRQQSKQKIQLKLLYPVILLVTAVAIVVFLLGFVVPDVVKVFADTGQELPQLTQALIASSDFIKDRGLLVLLGIVGFVVLFRLSLRNENFRGWWHRAMLKIPLAGRLVRDTNTARFASTLSILGSSGVPLVEAMKISGEVLTNDALKGAIVEAGQKVSEGTTLKTALDQAGHFPPMMLHMIASGEQSGNLDAMLERTANNQERDLEGMVEAMVGLFEPLMLLVMGGVVMVIVMAILLPILNLNQLV